MSEMKERREKWQEGEPRREKKKPSSTTLFYIGHLFVIKPRGVAQIPICSNQFPKNKQVKKNQFYNIATDNTQNLPAVQETWV